MARFTPYVPEELQRIIGKLLRKDREKRYQLMRDLLLDLQTLRVTRSLPLSTPAELHLTLVWTGLLSRRVQCSLAAGRGVASGVMRTA